MGTAMNTTPKLLTECREEDLVHYHAFVFGRVKIWSRSGNWHWSKTAWWKAMYYPHRGTPSNSGAWGVYAGDTNAPGDAELTHFLPMPPDPVAPDHEAARQRGAALSNRKGVRDGTCPRRDEARIPRR